MEKLTPLLNYIISNLEKVKNEDEDCYPDCWFDPHLTVFRFDLHDYYESFVDVK